MATEMERENVVHMLYAANRRIRSTRPFDANPGHCVYFRGGDLLEISVPCDRCPHDAEGTCIMCNYGSSLPLQSKEQARVEAEHILAEYGKGIHKLLLCTNGATLDLRCVPVPILDVLLELAQKCEAEKVIIETHVETINQGVLNHIRSFVKKPVLLELGLESVDPFVQHNCYLKDIPLEKIVKAICLGKEMGFDFQLNLMLGAPFLSEAEQIKDAELSIRWALAYAEYVTLFPMNIKDYSLLRFAYEKGIYNQISHWMMVLLLDRFDGKDLGRIDLAWYGNRDIEYEDTSCATVFPRSCENCRDLLYGFYESFNDTINAEQRKNVVKETLEKGYNSCSCLKNLRKIIEGLDDEIIQDERNSRVYAKQNKLLEALREEGF